MIETSNARAFVAGATGLTGRHAVAALGRRGIATVAHVRPDSASLERWRREFAAAGATVDTTPWELAAMTETLREVAPSVVFALLGTTRARAKRSGDASSNSYEAVDYGLTSLLRKACEASGGSPRFVYLSAAGLSESTRNEYMRVRVRIERELREGALPWTAVRPSFIRGERDDARPGEAIGAAVGDAALGLVGVLGGRRVRDKYRSITGEQLGDAIVRVAFDPTYENRVVEADELR